MKTWLFGLLVCAGSVAMAQPGAVAQPTKITEFKISGESTHLRVAAIQLGRAWKPERLLNVIRDLSLAPNGTTLTVDERQVNQRSARVVVHAQYRGKPIFDRELIVIVGNDGRVSSVNANVPKFKAALEPSVTRAQSLAILNEYLLRNFGPVNLTPSVEQTLGWVQFGEQLYPVVEVEVLDPVGFRHFTARIDQVNARVISVTERTKH